MEGGYIAQSETGYADFLSSTGTQYEYGSTLWEATERPLRRSLLLEGCQVIWKQLAEQNHAGPAYSMFEVAFHHSSSLESDVSSWLLQRYAALNELLKTIVDPSVNTSQPSAHDREEVSKEKTWCQSPLEEAWIELEIKHSERLKGPSWENLCRC